MNNDSPRTIKSYCRICFRNTRHSIIFNKHVTEDEEDYEGYAPDFQYDYQVLQCLGCEIISFREEFINGEVYDPESGPEILETLYPPVIKNHKKIDETYYLPEKINLIYSETIKAIEFDCFILAAGGLRAIIESVCNELKIKGRRLEIRIDNLAEAGHISKQEANRLHSARFLGNDSLHEIKKPQPVQLLLVLSIIEQLLTSLFITPAIIKINKEEIETKIDSYEGFTELLEYKVKRKREPGEFNLLDLFNNSIRRFKGGKKDIEKYQADLNKDILSNKIKFIELGSNTKGQQYYKYSSAI